MKLGISQQINNGNGKLVLTADNLKFACAEIGIPDDAHTLRRAARAFDLYHSGKVEHVNNHTFKVASQYDRQEPYEVKIKQTPYLKAGGYAYCTCQDWMNYSGDQDLPDVNFWCKHSISALLWLHKHGNGNGTKKVVNECGSAEAKALQDKLNGQLGSHGNNGNGAKQAPSQLDLSDPFQEAEQNDIDQIEGRRNGEVTWKLKNGEVVISYKGIMKLAEMHGIEFSEAIHSDTYTVITKGHCGTSERVSGKPINGDVNTAIELAKRNAARQLLPYAELRAVEKKAQLENEFNWQVAKAKCVELVGEANVNIIIHDLTQAGKLRQDNQSHYDRTEWLIIYEACKEDAQQTNGDGDNTPSSDPVVCVGLGNALLVNAVDEHKAHKKSLSRWSYNNPEFLAQCRQAIDQVRASKCIEANEQPLQNGNGNGKRKVQMDKKLRTWLIETDGTKKKISCREICETFESKQNPSLVTRLRAGIDSGADFSTVELN